MCGKMVIALALRGSGIGGNFATTSFTSPVCTLKSIFSQSVLPVLLDRRTRGVDKQEHVMDNLAVAGEQVVCAEISGIGQAGVRHNEAAINILAAPGGKGQRRLKHDVGLTQRPLA